MQLTQVDERDKPDFSFFLKKGGNARTSWRWKATTKRYINRRGINYAVERCSDRFKIVSGEGQGLVGVME